VSALGISLELGLLAAGALILVYMLLGGFIAVAYNDVVRALIMLLGLLVLPALAIVESGGVTALVRDLGALDPALVDPVSLGMGALVGFVGIGLGSPGQPHILVRYMAIDDAAKMRSVAWIGFAWNVVLGVGALAIGLAGRVLAPDATALPGGDSEMIYLVLSSELFGPLVYGVLVGGVFAAILSTADSQLLVVASTFARDVYERLLRAGRETDEASRVRVSRAVLLVAGLAAMGLAYAAEDLVFWLVLFAWGGLGAALGPTLILSLFWRGTTRAGVVAGMLTGSTSVIAWRLWLKDTTGLYELIPAFALALLATWLVSLVSAPPSSG
jgi:SSS family solute:Na+ symporter/sodium/proline symporter